eukprot:37749-Prorocentrum_lima.AAC.1
MRHKAHQAAQWPVTPQRDGRALRAQTRSRGLLRPRIRLVSVLPFAVALALAAETRSGAGRSVRRATKACGA